MPTIGLAELTIVVGYLVVIGLVIALPFWAIRQIRRNRSRVDQLERRSRPSSSAGWGPVAT